MTRQARRIARAMKAPLIFRSLPVIGAAATCLSCTVVSLHDSEATIPCFPTRARPCQPARPRVPSTSTRHSKLLWRESSTCRVVSSRSVVRRPLSPHHPLFILALSLSLHSGAPHYACFQSLDERVEASLHHLLLV